MTFQHTHTHLRDVKERYVDTTGQAPPPPPPSGKPSTEAFPLEHGHLRVGVGIRTSRSYDLLTEAVKEEVRDDKSGTSPPGLYHSLPHRASPRYSVHTCRGTSINIRVHTDYNSCMCTQLLWVWNVGIDVQSHRLPGV